MSDTLRHVRRSAGLGPLPPPGPSAPWGSGERGWAALLVLAFLVFHAALTPLAENQLTWICDVSPECEAALARSGPSFLLWLGALAGWVLGLAVCLFARRPLRPTAIILALCVLAWVAFFIYAGSVSGDTLAHQ